MKKKNSRVSQTAREIVIPDTAQFPVCETFREAILLHSFFSSVGCGLTFAKRLKFGVCKR